MSFASSLFFYVGAIPLKPPGEMMWESVQPVEVAYIAMPEWEC